MLVVKIGGGRGIDLDACCRDVAGLVGEGRQVLVVHGGSHLTNVVSEQLGRPPQFVRAVSGHESRYTDRETLAIFTMVYAGRVNKFVVERLQQLGVNAVGLSGVDGRLWEGPRKSAIRVVENGKVKVLRDDFTGRVERVNVGLLRILLAEGYVPVLCPPAISYEGEAINVDGDRAAGAVAAAMRAGTLVILSNVPGLLRDVGDESSLVDTVRLAEMDPYLVLAGGRMKKKLLGAREAVEAGVSTVILADGRKESPVRSALAGMGTVITR